MKTWSWKTKGDSSRAPGPFGIFTALFTCGPHIENADLPEVGTRLKGGEHRLPVVSHHLQSAPIHYVHLLSHLTCNRTKKVIPELIIPLTAFIFDSNLIKASTYPGGFAIHDNEAWYKGT